MNLKPLINLLEAGGTVSVKYDSKGEGIRLLIEYKELNVVEVVSKKAITNNPNSLGYVLELAVRKMADSILVSK